MDTRPALATADDVEALADQLTHCADAMHERILRDIAQGKLGLNPARTLFDDEVLLRERANALYADAAAHVVAQLGPSQQHVLDITRDAKEKIQKLTLIADVAALCAGLLGLAGAAIRGKPQAILTSLEVIYHAGQTLSKDGKAAPST